MPRKGFHNPLLCVIAVAGAISAAATVAHGGAPACPADCDLPADKQVGINDFLALLGNWGPCP